MDTHRAPGSSGALLEIRFTSAEEINPVSGDGQSGQKKTLDLAFTLEAPRPSVVEKLDDGASFRVTGLALASSEFLIVRARPHRKDATLHGRLFFRRFVDTTICSHENPMRVAGGEEKCAVEPQRNRLILLSTDTLLPEISVQVAVSCKHSVGGPSHQVPIPVFTPRPTPLFLGDFLEVDSPKWCQLYMRSTSGRCSASPAHERIVEVLSGVSQLREAGHELRTTHHGVLMLTAYRVIFWPELPSGGNAMEVSESDEGADGASGATPMISWFPVAAVERVDYMSHSEVQRPCPSGTIVLFRLKNGSNYQFCLGADDAAAEEEGEVEDSEDMPVPPARSRGPASGCCGCGVSGAAMNAPRGVSAICETLQTELQWLAQEQATLSCVLARAAVVPEVAQENSDGSENGGAASKSSELEPESSELEPESAGADAGVGGAHAEGAAGEVTADGTVSQSLESKDDNSWSHWLGVPMRDFTRQRAFDQWWRKTTLNSDYDLCETYPTSLVVPTQVSDETVRLAADYRSRRRLPVLSWRSAQSGAAVCRCSQPQAGLTMRTSPHDATLLHAISDMSTNEATDSDMQSQSQLVELRVTSSGMGDDEDSAGAQAADAAQDAEQERSSVEVSTEVKVSAPEGASDADTNSGGDSFGIAAVAVVADEDGGAADEDDDGDHDSTSKQQAESPSRLSQRELAGDTMANPIMLRSASMGAMSVNTPFPQVKSSVQMRRMHAPKPSFARSKSAVSQLPRRKTATPRHGLRSTGSSTEFEVIFRHGSIRSMRIDKCDAPAAHSSSLSSQGLLIADARPRINAEANKFKGKGYENVRSYGKKNGDIGISFFGVGNIHVMRKSLVSLASGASTGNWDRGIRESGWYSHISQLLTAGITVTRNIAAGQSVLVHCSDGECPSLSISRSYSCWVCSRYLFPFLLPAIAYACCYQPSNHPLKPFLYNSHGTGWDRTPQMICVALLILDPFYRTLKGFAVMVQREWFDMGHKFQHRCGSWSQSETSPVFLQFLDCVHQMISQSPLVYEFNDALLKFLALHAYSRWFPEFVCNAAQERGRFSGACSIWDVIERNSSTFTNSNFRSDPDFEIVKLSLDQVQPWTDMYLCGVLLEQESRHRASPMPPSPTMRHPVLPETIKAAVAGRSLGDLDGCGHDVSLEMMPTASAGCGMCTIT